MKKKLLALMLVLALMCTGLVGCGGSGSGDSEDAGNSTGKTELVLWMTYSDDSFDGLEQLVDMFNESSDEYHLTMEYGGTTTETIQKLNSLDKEFYPSLFTGSPDVLYEYSNGGYVVPLQDYLDKDDEQWEEDILDVAKKAYSDKDGVLQGGILGISAKGWMVNVDMLKAAGYTLDDITSMEKVAEITKAAHDKGLCKYGYTPYNGNEIVDILTYQGVDIFDGENGYGDSITKCLYNEGETHASLNKLMNLYAGLGDAFYYGGGGASGVSMFTNKQMLFWGCTNSFVYTLSDMNLDFEWAFVPYVGVDDNAKFKDCAIAEGTGLFISNTGDEKEMQGAYEVIKFLSSPEPQLAWCTYRGYIPYTNECVNSEEWLTWRNENFPSAEKLTTQLINTPDDLRLPYCQIGKTLMSESSKLHSKISSDATANVDTYINEVTESLNQAIELMNLRGQ